MMPILFAKVGDYKIASIKGGRRFRERLLSMGIKEGDQIRVIKQSPGPIIIAKNNMRIGIGIGMANKIYVV